MNSKAESGRKNVSLDTVTFIKTIGLKYAFVIVILMIALSYAGLFFRDLMLLNTSEEHIHGIKHYHNSTGRFQQCVQR